MLPQYSTGLLLDGLMFGQLLQMVWGGLIVYCIDRAITLSDFSEKEVRGTLVFNETHVFWRARDLTNFLMLR